MFSRSAYGLRSKHLLLLALLSVSLQSFSARVRDVLEQLQPYRGLVKHYRSSFTADRHDALDADTPFMANYAIDGAIVPVG